MHAIGSTHRKTLGMKISAWKNSLGFIKVKITITIQLQQVFNGSKMIVKFFRGQNRDMQEFSWT